MIIADKIENKAVFSDSLTDTGNYTIKASAKAFHILSTSLYTDPILAIVRELGCNARDSHVEAGVTKPWRLHLPTAYEPTLEIEDFGVGLDHEQVMNLFTTFFESTKTDSNEMVGALGLGSKSPFSYTDNYTVVATKNGERNTYTAYKTDDGIPAIVRLDTHKTDKENGVCIQIAIKSQDFHMFKERAISALRFFDQYPDCNMSGIFHKNVTDINIGENTLSYKKDAQRWNGNSIVVMGGIGYPLDKNRKDFREYFSILNNNIVLEANIGDVEMTPSREALTYNKKTTDWIISELEKVSQEIETLLNKTYKDLSCDYERLSFLNTNARVNLIGSTVSSMLKKYFAGNAEIKISQKFLTDHKISVRRMDSSYGSRNYISKKPTSKDINIVPRENVKQEFVWMDKKFSVRDMTMRAREFATILVFYDTTPETRKLIEKLLLGRKLVKASNFFTATEKEKREKTEFYTFMRASFRKDFQACRASGDIPKDVLYYVNVKRGKILDKLSTHGVGSWDVTEFVKKNINKVVGFTEKAKKPANLIDVYDYLDGQVENELKIVKSSKENLNFAAIQLLKFSGHSMSEFHNFKLKEMKLEDQTLVNMIKVSKGEGKTFEYLNKIRNVDGFDKIYEDLSRHVKTYYCGVNFWEVTCMRPEQAENFLNTVYKLNSNFVL